MKRSNSHNVLVLPVIVVLCACLSACGGSSRGADSPSRSSSAIVSPSAVPPSPSITGDYDGDDEKAGKHSSEGDNDDSTLPKDRDNDSDNSSGSYFDSDDKSVRGLGHAASAADRKTIDRLVKRYFAVAVAEDGKTACSMISSSIAKSIPETLGGTSGPPYARGTTCAAIMSKTFAHYHRQLAAHAVTLNVSAVRVDGNEGLVVLAFKALPGRQLRVARDGGVWRVGALLDLELP